jgi:hypothetical protein
VSPEDFSELSKIEIKRVQAERALFQEFIHVFQQSDLTEFALVLECEAMRTGENKEHSRMRRRLIVPLEIPERTGHAEMQSQPDVATGAYEEMFAVAAATFKATSFQSPRQLTRRNAFQHICALPSTPLIRWCKDVASR